MDKNHREIGEYGEIKIRSPEIVSRGTVFYRFTVVTLPILPVLDKTLRNSPTSDLAFICGSDGQPLTKETFGNYFRAACNKAGVHKSAHGVRKISATRAANAGATVAQLKALFGWTDDEMPSLYTKSADRVRLAKEAIKKLEK